MWSVREPYPTPTDARPGFNCQFATVGGGVVEFFSVADRVSDQYNNMVNNVAPDAGWSSSVARWAHNPEVVGSNPAPATRKAQYFNEKSLRCWVLFCPDKAESLCYSLPFSRTQARCCGGGGRAIIQHRGLSSNAPAGRKTILTLRMFSGKGWRRGICTA